MAAPQTSCSVVLDKSVMLSVRGQSRSSGCSSDNKTVAIGDADGNITVFDAATGAVQDTLRCADVRGGVRRVAFSSDDSKIVTVHRSGVVLWGARGQEDSEEARVLHVLRPENGARYLDRDVDCRNAFFLANDSVVITRSNMGCHLWDVAKGTCKAQIDDANGEGMLIPTADASKFARCTRTSVVLYDSNTGQKLRRLRRAANCVTFSADGGTIVTGSLDDDGRTVIVWDAATFTEQARLRGHSRCVHDVTLFRDGTTLATGSSDKTVILWDVAQGKVRTRLKVDGPAFRLRSSSNGMLAALVDRSTESSDKEFSLELWDVGTRQKHPLLSSSRPKPLLSVPKCPFGMLPAFSHATIACVPWEGGMRVIGRESPASRGGTHAASPRSSGHRNTGAETAAASAEGAVHRRDAATRLPRVRKEELGLRTDAALLHSGHTAKVHPVTFRDERCVAEVYHKPIPIPNNDAMANLTGRPFLRHHPHIVGVCAMIVDGDGDDDFLCGLVFQRVDGRTLAELLKDRSRAGVDTRPRREPLKCVRDIAAAIASVHSSGLVHGGISLDSVVVRSSRADKREDTTDVWLKDPRAAHVASTLPAATTSDLEDGPSSTAAALFLPPECSAGDTRSRHASDVFAFGMLAWHVFHPGQQTASTNARQIDRGRRPQFDPSVPPAVKALVAQCWNRKHTMRPTMRAVLATLEQALRAGSSAPRHVSPQPMARQASLDTNTDARSQCPPQLGPTLRGDADAAPPRSPPRSTAPRALHGVQLEEAEVEAEATQLAWERYFADPPIAEASAVGSLHSPELDSPRRDLRCSTTSTAAALGPVRLWRCVHDPEAQRPLRLRAAGVQTELGADATSAWQRDRPDSVLPEPA